MNRRVALGALVIGGLQALSFAPDPLPSTLLPWLQVITLATLFHLVTSRTRAKAAAGVGWFFGLGTFVTGLYWLTVSMHQYGGMPLWMAIVALLGFCAYLALYPALASWVYRRFSPDSVKDLGPGAIVGTAGFWAALWTLVEWLRGSLLTGFAWLNTSAGQVDGWLSGWAPLVGPYGVTFLTVWLSAVLTLTLSNAALRKPGGFSGLRTVPMILAGVTLAGGALLMSMPLGQPTAQPLVIRLVQGDIDQAIKFTPDGFLQAVELYQSLSGHEQDAQKHKPDLVLLPETVMTYMPGQISPDIWQSWSDVARDHDTTILMGSPMPTTERGYTNSVIAITENDTGEALSQAQVGARYDKSHLVPFGEFVPYGFQWFVDAMNIPLGNFSAGHLDQAPMQFGSQAIAPNICYEDVFAENLLPAVHNGATILANFSNLGWFGDTLALPQHWQMARLRAMETRRPTVRSTNTGMTGAIDHLGQTIAMLPTMTAGYLDVVIQGHTGLTPYVRTGNAPTLIVSAIIVLGAILRRRRSTPHTTSR